MPKLKNRKKGRRVNLWVPERQDKILKQIDNHSKFFQLALDNAAGIMAWAIMKERQPDQYYDVAKLEDVVGSYNEKYPLNPLTKQRLTDERANRSDPDQSQKPHRELW